ncbi:MAG: ABC transporter substrate-binding protein [Candidatus Hodarchaeales archaeon]
MRKFSMTLISILMINAIFLPFFPVIAQPKLAAIPTFKIGTNGSRLGNWDGPIASAGFAGSNFGPECLEPFFILPDDWSGDYNDAIPALATNWSMIPWPNEMNHHPTNPFFNTGGVKAIEFTLRENVTFHDGSAFNATVAKWNIDRHIVITGNLTGKLDPNLLGEEMYKAMYSFWLPAEHWAQYETDSWNVSQFIGKTASYAEFGASQTPQNTDLYRTYYNGTYPRIKNVTVIEDNPNGYGGGKIRVNYNDWSGVLLYVDFTMISMDAYKDYFDVPIVGMGDIPGFLQPDVRSGYPDPDVQFPGHLIGTGPYRLIEFDEVSEQGTMRRYGDWWNSTAMQANDLHQVEEIAIVTFKFSQSGYAKKSLALLSRTIDYADDGGNMDVDAMNADPNINYIVSGIGTDRTFITLNAINETYWKTWADGGSPAYNLSDPAGPAGADLSFLYDVDADGTVHVDGINRAMRKAVSYAFDYDLYLSNILQGRGVRSGGFLSPGNEYYNPDIPLPYRNLTIARQALIDDPYWGGICSDRGLGVANLTNDQDWIDVANTNPITVFKLLWDGATFPDASLFGNSIKSIGLVLGGSNGAPDPALEVSPDIYTVLFTEGALPTVPWFTSHGLPSAWPGANYAFGPYIEYYCKSPEGTVFPYAGLINTGFNYNDTVDFWIDKTWFVNRTAGQELWDNLTRHYQTFQFSDIFICHTQYGYAIDKDWEWYPPYLGTEFVKYVGPPIEEGVPIPGFQTAVIIVISVVTITGIGYTLNRKRKRS